MKFTQNLKFFTSSENFAQMAKTSAIKDITGVILYHDLNKFTDNQQVTEVKSYRPLKVTYYTMFVLA